MNTEDAAIEQSEYARSNLPEFKCHKRVKAAKIERIEQLPTLNVSLHLECILDPVTVDPLYISRHNPAIGGYFVLYNDGYCSYSPAQAFEEGYHEVLPMMTGEATGSCTATTQVTDTTIEQEIQAKGLTAPRVTPADIEANIASEHYFTAADGVIGNSLPGEINPNPATYSGPSPLSLLTFCVLVLRNGFTVTGESACASPENFDAELGRKIARQNAVSKMWPLMGYALKERLTGAVVPTGNWNTPEPPAAPQDFKTRLFIEHGQLQQRTEKLEAFIGTDKFNELPEIERTDLLEQLPGMRQYLRVLTQRVSRQCNNA